MKKALLPLMAFVTLTSLVFAADKPAASVLKGSSFIGTWELVSEKWGDAQSFSDPPANRKSIKIINPTHFIWVWVDPKTQIINNSMGGTYKQSGDTYIETIGFAAAGMEAYVGKEQKFNTKVEGETWTHSGVLSNGQKLEEVWKRVK